MAIFTKAHVLHIIYTVSGGVCCKGDNSYEPRFSPMRDLIYFSTWWSVRLRMIARPVVNNEDGCGFGAKGDGLKTARLHEMQAQHSRQIITTHSKYKYCYSESIGQPTLTWIASTGIQ